MSAKHKAKKRQRTKYPPVRNQQTINDFAARIKILLHHYKMSLSQLSADAEINYDYLKQIINAKVNPSICHEENIALGFGITRSQLTDNNYFPELQNTVTPSAKELTASAIEQ